MKQSQLNTTSVYRRLSQVSLSVALLIVVLSMWVSTDSASQQLQSDHTSDLTRLLTQQSSLVAMRFIKQKQTDALQSMLNDLTTNRYIDQSMVYDKTGKVIAQSTGAITAHQTHITSLAPKSEQKPQSAQSPAPLKSKMYITEIMDNDKLIGYLRINYLHQQALATPLLFHKNIMRQILLMMIISGVTGFMLTRGFARFSRNSYRVVEVDVE